MQYLALVILAISSRILAQAPKIAVTGVQTGVNPNTGARPSRTNINDLYINGGPAWYVSLTLGFNLLTLFRDLYIQALLEFQAVNETDELSYFQIMGVQALIVPTKTRGLGI